MAFRKRKKKRGKNPTVRASTASSMDKEDVGEQGITNSAVETGSLSRNEIDEADGLFFKSVQMKSASEPKYTISCPSFTRTY